jgi:hypothetical protein
MFIKRRAKVDALNSPQSERLVRLVSYIETGLVRQAASQFR